MLCKQNHNRGPAQGAKVILRMAQGGRRGGQIRSMFQKGMQVPWEQRLQVVCFRETCIIA